MSQLILVRHGESEWNAKGIWTGLTDIGLSEKGKEQARLVGEKLKGFSINFAFTSVLIRAKQTLNEVKSVLGIDVPTFEDKALNERDYGIYTGKNKWEIKKEVGDEQFQNIRRGWDVPIENGESLKDVYNRVVPYYEAEILPKLKEGKNILIVAHGNSLRALVKYLENLSDDEVKNLEILFDQIYFYEISPQGDVSSKKVVNAGD
ncbi:MAG: 2,3-diphosphoglycerate-dependent phosphoglycerate mutase [Candidatus Levybacteria bacterium]|nr:2,3-diphosphoglycerate-dependent phosphoglycerate mutase [Candidatus Levybacteria bacterium]